MISPAAGRRATQRRKYNPLGALHHGIPAKCAHASHKRFRASGSDPMPGVGSSLRLAHSCPETPAVSSDVASQIGVSAALPAGAPKVLVIQRKGPPTSIRSEVFLTSPG